MIYQTMYVDVTISSRTTECRKEKTEEVNYLQVKNNQLMREFVRKLEESIVERVEGVQIGKSTHF